MLNHEHELEEKKRWLDIEACQKDASSAFGAKILCHCGGGIGGQRVPKWATECHLTCVSANEADLKLGDTGTSWPNPQLLANCFLFRAGAIYGCKGVLIKDFQRIQFKNAME